MPYKIRDQIPSSKANSVEIADYIEVECLKKTDLRISFLEILKSFDVGDDYQEDDSDEDNNFRDNQEEKKVENAFSEIEQRGKHCNGKYPFIIENNIVQINTEKSVVNIIYFYLLLATRLTMGGPNSEKVFNEIDGTLLFEKLCQVILNSFYGERSNSILFGTSAKGFGFESKVQQLIRDLKEGGIYKNRNPHTPKAQDDNLDVVAWKGFSDFRGSQLIGFAQCKTGNTWRDDLGQLSPDKFINSWFSDNTSIMPTSIFMVADIVRHDHYTTFMQKLFFDRCRLMDYLPEIVDSEIVSDIKSWLTGASLKYKFNLDFLLN